MARNGLSAAAAFLALLGIAPWAVYLGGVAKLTDVLTGFEWQQAVKQIEIMLEWYIISSQFVNLLVIAIVGSAGGLRRCHSTICMFLAVATTLLILQATARIQQINAIREGAPITDRHILQQLQALLVADEDPLPYLRAIAAGQISTATWNFFLAILVSFAGTAAQTGLEPELEISPPKAVAY